MYSIARPQRPPAWLKDFREVILDPEPNLKSSASSAVLIVEAETRTFAITYGHGRSLIKREAWEQDFGIKVVLNTVDPHRIRQIERNSFDAILQSSSSQSAREASIDEFGLDVEQDVIKSLRGKPTIERLGKIIRGRDSLNLSLVCKMVNLPALLKLILEEHEKETYKEVFPFIDRLKEVRDLETKQRLDSVLMERIKESAPERVWLAPPMLIQWLDGSYLQYSTDEEEQLEDIHLSTFLPTLADRLNGLSTADLRSAKVRLISNDDAEIDHWSVYDCFYCEVDEGNFKYVLNGGK